MENNVKAENLDTFKIPIEELFSVFEEHLDIENNKRIFFSGKFGIGKTYFLNEFFKNKKDKYECYHLFLVNYQINSNEDIVDFLKFDILVEMKKKNETIFSDDDYKEIFNTPKLFYIWGKDNIEDVISLISIIFKLGRPFIDIATLIEKFLKFKEEIQKGEGIKTNEFLEKIRDKKITESDYLSEIIKKKITEQKGEKKSVLILDDLDRIDPEHIFRILNVFSAHFDEDGNEIPNKFGFDKVIIVADFSNLESIFHHKYGQDTDSSGYFNKFFSVEIFQFKNEELIKKVIKEIISKFNIKDNDVKKAINGGYVLVEILNDILIKALDINGKEKLNMRQLLKGIKFPLKSFDMEINWNNQEIMMYQLIKISILICSFIFDGLDSSFVSVLEKIKTNIEYKKYDKSKESLYKKVTFYLLKRILGSLPESTILHWEKYEIEIQNQIILKVSANNKKIDVGILFYDLLIEYMKQNLHNRMMPYW